MIKISPEQFVEQWANAPHRFEVNVHNFEVKAGRAAVDVFQKSFDLKKLNTARSTRWARWQGSYSSSGSLLEDTGTLRNSIKVKSVDKHKVTIFTDPAEFRNSRRHKGFCFAKVHNDLDSLAKKPARGPKVRRQFIGDSTVLEKELDKLNVEIFNGFPKSRVL